MSLVFSRGRIVGWSATAFLVGVGMTTLGLISIRWMMWIEILLVISAISISLWRIRREFVIVLCLFFACFGMLRTWSEGVPLLRLTNPNGAMRAASVVRKRTQEEVIPLWMTEARRTLTGRIQTMLPKEEAALLSGILYGERLFTKETQQTFKRAGLMHIVAVSGANISILVLIIARTAIRVGCSRKHAWGILVGSIFVFVIFVAPSASVTRAAIMGIFVELAPLCGRLIRPTRLLLVAATLFVLWQPSALFLDAGFALSFLAMIGLICLGPYIDGWLPKQCPQFLRETCSSTFAATIMTAPYLAWVFHSWSLLGCLTNLLIVPLIPWTMLFGAIALVLPVGQWIFLPVRGCLSLILWIAHLTDPISVGVWDKISFSWLWMIAIYTILFSIWRLGEQRKRLIHKKRP
jgi:ComEC/Rec2-related protein